MESFNNYYTSLRVHNKQIQTQREKEVFNKIPKIKDLRNFGTIIRNSISNGTSPLEKINENKKIIKSKLIEKGYPENYLEPIYTCPKCKDEGYLKGNIKCDCRKKKESALLLKNSNLGRLVNNANFDNFKLGNYDCNTFAKEVLEESKNFTKKIINNKNCDDNLIFLGPTGTGKTLLSSCIVKESTENLISTYYSMAKNIIEDALDKEYQEKNFNKKRIYESKLLVIDDLGAENNKYASEIIFDILNYRLNKGLNTVISTNLTLKEIKAIYSERVYSRIKGYFKQLILIGKDHRLIQENKLNGAE